MNKAFQCAPAPWSTAALPWHVPPHPNPTRRVPHCLEFRSQIAFEVRFFSYDPQDGTDVGGMLLKMLEIVVLLQSETLSFIPCYLLYRHKRVHVVPERLSHCNHRDGVKVSECVEKPFRLPS